MSDRIAALKAELRAERPARTTRKLVAPPPALWTRVEDFQIAECIASTSEALKRLIMAGLEWNERKPR